MKPPPALQLAAGMFFASYEENTDFRMLLLRHCKNGMFLSGILGIIITLIYIFTKTFIFGHSFAWWYSSEAIRYIVLWDKLLIIILCILVILMSRSKMSLRSNRIVVFLLCLACAVAILTDDILNVDVNFSSGYLTILLLITVSFIPFKPWQTFTLCCLITFLLFFSLNNLPYLLGVSGLQIASNQLLHLSSVTVILTGISTFLYHSRHTLYTARRKADGLLDGYGESITQDDHLIVQENDLQSMPENKEAELPQFVRDISVKSVDQVFLEEVKLIIENHIGDSNFGVEWLAHEAAISPRQLQRRLKSAVGISAGKLIRIMRLQRSAQLIKHNAGTISEIAYRVGFNDPAYFSKLFRDMYGVNPSDYSVKMDKTT
jgi:AraC-like DNA-binding protein